MKAETEQSKEKHSHVDQGHLLQSSNDRVISRLRVEVGVKQERVILRPPAIGVTHAPDCDTDALRNLQTGLRHSSVVSGAGADDIQLRDRDLLDAAAGKGLQGAEGVAALVGLEVSLGA